MRSAEDTDIFKIDRYFMYFLFLTYLAQFKSIFRIPFHSKNSDFRAVRRFLESFTSAQREESNSWPNFLERHAYRNA